jgi:hypothetical protein
MKRKKERDSIEEKRVKNLLDRDDSRSSEN